VAVFAALGEVQPKGVLGLDAGEEGMSIDGELIGELTASFDMVDGSWSSVVFDPEVLEDGLATTGQFSGSLGEVREYVQEKC
jgi:hypothetical protein